MKQLNIVATFLVGVSFCNVCEESVLLVGGQDASGPLSSMQLLTESGWCDNINFPDLEEPIVNPGVYAFEESRYRKIILIVCGFADGNCKWTHNGAIDWLPLQVPPSPWAPDITLKDFQIVDWGGTLSMISVMKDDDSKGCTHTISKTYPPVATFVTEFDQEIHIGNTLHKKDITGSCYAHHLGLMVLSGGRTPMMEEPSGEYWQTKYSHTSVGGNFNNQFWADYYNELHEAREHHACSGIKNIGSIVGGGNNYNYFFSEDYRHIWVNQTYETLASVELLVNDVWTTEPQLNTARQDFGIVEVCRPDGDIEDPGYILAIGGRDYSGEHIEHRERIEVIHGAPWWKTTITDNTKETFLDSIEIMGYFSWTHYKYNLRSPMSSFGVAKVHPSICKDP